MRKYGFYGTRKGSN